MYFVRTPCEWGMDAISATLTFLWEVVGYVEGLFFKDLKQTMKKEQCEVKLLVTASMPGKPPDTTFHFLTSSWDFIFHSHDLVQMSLTGLEEPLAVQLL